MNSHGKTFTIAAPKKEYDAVAETTRNNHINPKGKVKLNEEGLIRDKDTRQMYGRPKYVSTCKTKNEKKSKYVTTASRQLNNNRGRRHKENIFTRSSPIQ